MDAKNLIIVITGETGSGKSYLERYIFPQYPNIEVLSKYTTRKPRIDEENVKDVHAGLSKDEVAAMDYTYINPLNNETYGIKKEDIDESLSRGKIPCVDLSNEEAYIKMLEDYPNSILILKIVPCFDEESMKDTFERQGREASEFAIRRSALVSPLTNWVYKYPNMREIINPYFMRSLSDSLSSSVVAHRLESILNDECHLDLGVSIARDNNYMGIYKYLYYYSKHRPVDDALNFEGKGLK